MEVNGDIPDLVPGSPGCQPINPDRDHPLLNLGASAAIADAKPELVSISVQTEAPVGEPRPRLERGARIACAPAPGEEEQEEQDEFGEGEDQQVEAFGYDKQMDLVPPPRPHKEARLRRLAKTVPHILIHP